MMWNVQKSDLDLCVGVCMLKLLKIQAYVSQELLGPSNWNLVYT